MIVTIKSLLTFITLLSFLPAGLSFRQTIVSEWNEAYNEAVLNLYYGPTAASHLQALVHTAMYNAWVPYDSKAVSAYGVKELPRQSLSERTYANKHEAISYAAYYSLKSLAPTQQSIFDRVMQRHGYSTDTRDPDPNTAAGIGIIAAKRVIKARWNDGSNQRGDLNPSGEPYSEPILLSSYEPYRYINTADQLNDISYWQPLRNPDGSSQEYTTPHFGLVTPFSLESGSQFRPEKAPKSTYNDYDGFLAEHQLIYDIYKALTPRQILIAEYWEGTGRFENTFYVWSNITRDISKRDKNSLDEDVKMFFIMGNAFLDAAIAVYDAKRHYNSARPITVIRNLIDPTWESLVPTPSHPDFVSGHASTSASVLEVLRSFTGSDYYGGSYTDEVTGLTLSWKTFTETLKEIGLARMYAGIHTQEAVLAGEKQGAKVGKVVWRKFESLIEGRHSK